MKRNCWEVKKCGREPGGANLDEFGVCPASIEERLSGVHGGKNAGRACWVVAGSMCQGTIQGTFAEKYKDCSRCDFYRMVQDEEFPNFELAVTIINKLRQGK